MSPADRGPTDAIPLRLPKRRIPLALRVLIGVALGVFLGAYFGQDPIVAGLTNADLGRVGMLVIRLLKALATPLILVAILDAFCRTAISGRAGLKLIVICLINVSVAFAIGLTILNVWRPGEQWRGRLGELEAETRSAESGAPAATPNRPDSLSPLDALSGYVPESVVAPLAENNVVPMILLALLGGAAIRRVKRTQRAARDAASSALDPEAPPPPLSIETLERLIEASYQVIMRMLLWVVELVPLAVLGATAEVVGRFGLSVFWVLGTFLVTMLAGLGIHSLIYYPLAAWVAGRRSPRQYLGQGADAILMGLSANSSLATTPLTLSTLTDRLGVSEASARLSACVGTNLNNDGITLYEAMAALFLAQAVGLELSFWQQAAVVLASLMAGAGMAGIPQAGWIILPLVLSAAGLSEAAIATALPLIIPVDWIVARARSGVNVMSDLLVAILLDRPWFRAESRPD